MAVSEGAIVQLPVYRLRRIYFPRTRVYKGKKKMGRSTNADLALHNFNELSRPIIIVTPRPAGLGFRAYYSLTKARGLQYRSRRAPRRKLMIWRLMIATIPAEPARSCPLSTSPPSFRGWPLAP